MCFLLFKFTISTAATLALALPTTEVEAASLHQTPAQTDIAQEPALPSGVTLGDWSSIRDLISAHNHALEETAGGFRASNPRFDWKAQFDGTSVLIQPASGDWSFGLALKGFGFEGAMQHMESPTFGSCVQGKEITYDWTDKLSEWWINDKRGFEHGFTVHVRPEQLAMSDVSPLVFELDVLGSLQPRVNGARTGLSLQNDAGLSMLRYDGLVAFDANGASLSAWLEVDERSIRICVDEALAKYPILVDPILHEAYIKASNTDGIDQFGYSVAASGDTVVVGAWGEASVATGIDGDQSSNAAWRSGAAYIFVRAGSSWIQQAYIKASNTETEDLFGYSVAASGDTVVVGALWEDSNATGIGGDQSNNSALDSGAAYVFVRSGSSWTQQAYLKASNTGTDDNFGNSVAVSGDTVVVGAHREGSDATGIDGDQSNNLAPYSGAVYVFVRAGSSWTQQAYLKASNTEWQDQFGCSVAASGDTVVVGANSEDSSATGIDGDQSNNLAGVSGAAYVFVRSGSSWIQQAYLKASNTDRSDWFGSSVAASGDTVVVGAPGEDSGATGINGNQSNNSFYISGAVYVFIRSGSSWTQQAYLKASNTDGNDYFGISVAASGDTVIVGAGYEDSNATGINGHQSNNLARNSGAAYAFVRSGSTWTQLRYLKATNTDAGDLFGISVATSGNTTVVGAYNESSSATGINGDQSNNTASHSGAAYIFGISGAVGTPYCMATPNSTGSPGELTGIGSTSLTDNCLTLVAAGLPVGVFGFYLTGMVQGLIMNPGGSDGNLCFGGAIGRYNGPGQILQSDATGSFSLLLDPTHTPTPNGPVSINAGETWYFQGWFRDTSMTGPTSNFTNGLQILFTL